jgi:predicted PurR-regulated permease PerM
LIVQQVLFNMIMPRLMGQIVGLHPLLVFAAILVGGAVAGAWGILFGIPVAGVIASVAHFFYLRAIGAVPPPSSAEGAGPAPADARRPEAPPTGSVVEEQDKVTR